MSEVETTVARSLEETPTWALAPVCFVLISVSIIIEHSLHLLAKYFRKKRRRSLIQALDKVKTELMLLGFISLLLTACEKPIANICIPKGAAKTFLPCNVSSGFSEEEVKCEEQGKVSLMSVEGVRELQYLIFVLAFFHSLSCLLTSSLGMAKMRRWESWEAETRTLEYQFSNDPRRFQLIHQTSFARRHLRFWSDHRFLRWPACFIRQFYKSVSKVDYFTLRHGFVMAHFDGENNFDFQKYIKRALEKDFKEIVTIGPWIWSFSVFFIFFNAHVFHNYFWLPFIPLVMLLLVGTKLQGIITKMCLDTHEKSQVVQGTFLVRPSDNFFWFGRPKLLLHLMHFILFQNSFQLAFFAWTWYKFGLRSCFHRENEDIVIRLAMGILVQILCGYVTLPLYALVTQMGTSMKKTVFPETIVEGLSRWRAAARKNLALRSATPTRPSIDTSISLETSPSFSVDAPFSARLYPPSENENFAAGEVGDEEEGRRRPEEQQKISSFDGFVVGNKT